MHDYVERVLHDIGSLASAALYALLIIILTLVNSFLAIQLFIGGICIVVLTTIIRITYFKVRPRPKKYTTWIEKIDASSFPSTHAARAAYILTLLWTIIPTHFKILGIFLVISISYSRIARKRHDVIDVLGGIVLGIGVGIMVLQF